MKKYINKLIVLCALVILSASCDDDAPLTYLSEVSFSSAIEATPNTIVIASENIYQPVVTISWPKVDFPVAAPVSYELQFDIPSDTLGTTAWSHAIVVDAGEDVLSKSFVGNDLNAIALDLGLPQDIPGEILVRVSATLDRTVYSEFIIITVTPNIFEVYMPGSYQGWNPATASRLKAIDTNVYQGYATFPEGALGFKITPEMDWDEFYGSTGGNGIALGDDDDLSVPSPGSYQITVDLNTLTFTAVPYDFGIIGTATPGGWDADTDMVFDHIAEQWTYTGNLVGGAIKFRLNDAWTVNYGSANGENGEINNGTVILDNPGAHTINDTGNYTVTFRVNTNVSTASYSIVKN
jgi:hypothetical protein